MAPIESNWHYIINYLFAESLFRRLLYPTLAVTVVGGTIYLSSAENRATFWSKASKVYEGGVANWKGKER